jgi:peptide/nickel transport system ATP-binding protein
LRQVGIALDVSVRAQVLNLMRRMQRQYGMAYLFISHDLSVVRYLCDRVEVLYLGQVVESAAKKELFENPMHPYTKALMAAIPLADVDNRHKRILLEGDIPSPMNPPSGCRFHTPCKYAAPECAMEQPQIRDITSTHRVACLYAGI